MAPRQIIDGPAVRLGYRLFDLPLNVLGPLQDHFLGAALIRRVERVRSVPGHVVGDAGVLVVELALDDVAHADHHRLVSLRAGPDLDHEIRRQRISARGAQAVQHALVLHERGERVAVLRVALLRLSEPRVDRVLEIPRVALGFQRGRLVRIQIQRERLIRRRLLGLLRRERSDGADAAVPEKQRLSPALFYPVIEMRRAGVVEPASGSERLVDRRPDQDLPARSDLDAVFPCGHEPAVHGLERRGDVVAIHDPVGVRALQSGHLLAVQPDVRRGGGDQQQIAPPAGEAQMLGEFLQRPDPEPGEIIPVEGHDLAVPP